MSRLLSGLIVTGWVTLLHAAPFENLGFDEANTNNAALGFGSTGDLLPGWQLFQGTNAVQFVNLNTVEVGGTGFAELFNNDPRFPAEGRYALGLFETQENTMPFTLIQRGDVPQDARLLEFRYFNESFLVTVDGVQLQPVSGGGRTTAPQEEVFDISQFAGKNVELQLTTVTENIANNDEHLIDSIRFVPEPSTWLLSLLGLGCIWCLKGGSSGFSG
jgi:hypothetical protein